MSQSEPKPLVAVTHVHKTAGTTLSGLLKRAYGSRYALVYTENVDDPYFSAEQFRTVRNRFFPRLDVVMGHDVKPWGDLDTLDRPLRWVTFLRHPVVRCASHYQYDLQRGSVEVPFRQWIDHPGVANRQTETLAGPGATAADALAVLDRFDFVGLQERFDRSLVLLREKLGIPSIAYTSRWRARVDDIKQRLLDDPGSVEALEAANQEDIQLYRHVVEEVFPKQEADFGVGLDAAEAWAMRANRGTTRAGMLLTPRYLAYLVRWRLRYDPWVRRQRGE